MRRDVVTMTLVMLMMNWNNMYKLKRDEILKPVGCVLVLLLF